MERRVRMREGILAFSSVKTVYGPAHIAVTYVLKRAVRAKRWRMPPSTGSADDSTPLATTVHAAGATTVSANVAFKSGWSKQGKYRFALNGSQSVNTYS